MTNVRQILLESHEETEISMRWMLLGHYKATTSCTVWSFANARIGPQNSRKKEAGAATGRTEILTFALKIIHTTGDKLVSRFKLKPPNGIRNCINAV